MCVCVCVCMCVCVCVYVCVCVCDVGMRTSSMHALIWLRLLLRAGVTACAWLTVRDSEETLVTWLPCRDSRDAGPAVYTGSDSDAAALVVGLYTDTGTNMRRVSAWVYTARMRMTPARCMRSLGKHVCTNKHT